MIYVVELECPHQHTNGGVLHEYPSEKPPPEWCQHISLEFAKWIKTHPAEFAKCDVCGEPMGRAWRYVVSSLTCKTMEEAVASFDKVGRRVATFEQKTTHTGETIQ